MQTLLDTPHSLFSYAPLFRTLRAPTLSDLTGDFEAALVGPAWFCAVSRVSLRFGGLPDWFGKRFDGAGRGINLLGTEGALREALPMRVSVVPSLLDGNPVAAVRYAADAPFPWRYVVDELRVADERTLLGMTLLDLPVARRFALPFLLRRP